MASEPIGSRHAPIRVPDGPIVQELDPIGRHQGPIGSRLYRIGPCIERVVDQPDRIASADDRIRSPGGQAEPYAPHYHRSTRCDLSYPCSPPDLLALTSADRAGIRQTGSTLPYKFPQPSHRFGSVCALGPGVPGASFSRGVAFCSAAGLAYLHAQAGPWGSACPYSGEMGH